MKFEIDKYLYETDKKHCDMVDAYAYMIAAQFAKIKDDYFFLYIMKNTYWYMPDFVYKWFIKKFVNVVRFK